MATPFSYAQAASKAPTPAEAPASTTSPSQPVGTVSQDTTAAAPPSDPTKSSASSSAGSVRPEAVKAPKATDTEAKQTTGHMLENNIESTAATQPTMEQPKTSGTDVESIIADSRPRSDTQDLSMASSIRSSSAEKTGEGRKARRNRKNRDHAKEGRKDGKADKEGDATKDEVESAPLVELTPAPLPTVNPWKKAPTGFSSTTGANGEVSSVALGEAPVGEAVPSSADSTSASKGGDIVVNGEQGHRGGQRGTRGGEKEEKKPNGPVLPPANDDPTSWPTLPEGEEPKSSKPQPAKPQATEGATPAGKQKKQKWDKLELEHAVYTNPIASRGGRGRGGARGGRDGGRGASAAVNGSGPAAAGSSSARPAHETKPRGREGSSGRAATGGRANNNSPSGSRRVPASEAGPRKQSVASAKDAVESAPAISRTQQSKTKSETSGAEQQHYNINNHTREAGPGTKDPAANARDRENGRGERGRGGYRGRGGHASGAHGHSHSYSHSHSHSQQGYAGHGGYNNSARQGPFSPTGGTAPYTSGHGRGSRGSARGQFGRNGGPPSAVANLNPTPTLGVNGPLPHRVDPIVTGASMPPPYSYANPGPPYSAPPVSSTPQVLNSEGMLIVLTRQVSYWFSKDNLVKDTWLRKHMDDDGFVPFSLIAGFTRVKQLLATDEDLRYAIAGSNVADLWCANDGVERIRCRHNWQDWIFPHLDRFDGGKMKAVEPFMVHSPDYIPPQPVQPWFQGANNNAPYYPAQFPQPEANPSFAHHYNHQQQYPVMNGMVANHYNHGRGLTAEAPEFAPTNEAGPAGINGAWASQNGDGNAMPQHESTSAPL
ncbi:hypothetical protein MKZ38_006351 [Zalerion maritima]|uniref:HTH La-type RNA-binding domain-containing protein n=1 Tax=Zalerion maritima TaxID=339359 RepID=A0AAD5RWK4_9PEZI|nr:hypothetical protein MKZ38_006351 [Zalerion maritima]